MSDQTNPLGPEGSYFEAKAREREEKDAKTMNGIYPILITGVYLVLGFFFNLWHPAWLLFLTIPLYYMHPKSTLQKLGNPVTITLIYLILGFYFHLWHPGWLIFMVIPIAAIASKHEGE